MMTAWRESRARSFVAVSLIYILATAAGVLVYRALPFDFWLSLLVADIAATVVTFIFSVMFGNASVYDPYWSVQPPVILFALALGKPLGALGILLLVAVSLWAIRLTANWAYTFGGLMHQDWRYTMLAEKTGALYPAVNFLGIHLVPTLVVYGCILPAAFVIQEGISYKPQCLIFIFVSLFAVIMQTISDIQMHKYRKNRDGAFNRHGLWKYARHPNYLGEILMWWGIGLAVFVAAPDRWYLLFGALSNTALFLFVSIPLADGRQSKKEGFAEYKRETRALLPIKKRGGGR